MFKKYATYIKYREFYGLLLVLIGAIFFSTKAILVKLSYQFDPSPVSILALRMIFSLPFYIAILYLNKKKEVYPILPTKKDYIWLIVMGIAGYYFSSLMDFQGLKYVTASLERLILFIYPTLVILISAIIFRTKVGKKEILALLLTYAGISFVIINDFSLDQKDLIKGSIFIFLSALSYAIYLIGSGRLIPVFGPVRFTTYAMIISCVVVITHFFIISDLSDLIMPFQVYIYTSLMAIFATVIPSFLLAKGIKMIGSGKASIIGSIGPVSTIFLALLFLGESINIFQIIGAAFVILGILLLNVSPLIFLKKAFKKDLQTSPLEESVDKS